MIIKKPETGDTGRYTCTVRECNDLSTKAYLEVERKFFIDNINFVVKKSKRIYIFASVSYKFINDFYRIMHKKR